MNQNKKIEKFTDNLFFKSQRSRSPIPGINFHFKKLPTLKCQKPNTTRAPLSNNATPQNEPIYWHHNSYERNRELDHGPQKQRRQSHNRRQFRQSRQQLGLSKNDIDKLELMCADLNGEDYLAKLIQLHQEERIKRNQGNLEQEQEQGEQFQEKYGNQGIDVRNSNDKHEKRDQMKIEENSQSNIMQSKNSSCELMIPCTKNDEIKQIQKSSPKKSIQSKNSNNKNEYNIKVTLNNNNNNNNGNKIQKSKQKRISLTKRIPRNNNPLNNNNNNNNIKQQKSKQFVFVKTARSVNKAQSIKFDHHKRSQSSTIQRLGKNNINGKVVKVQKQKKSGKKQQNKKIDNKKQKKLQQTTINIKKDTQQYSKSTGVSAFQLPYQQTPKQTQQKEQTRYYNELKIPKNKKLQQICYSQIGKRMVTVTQKQIHRQFFKTNLHIRAYIMKNIVSYIQSLAQYSPNSIFILPNQRALHFQAHLKPQQLQNYLQHTKYIEIIKNVNHIIQKNIFKQKYQEGQPSYWSYTLISMFVIFIVMMSLIIFLSHYNSVIKNALIIGTAFIICVILVMLIGYSLHCYGMKTEFVPVCQIIYQDIDSYFKYVNGKMENQLEWVVGDSFFWLEVRINKGSRAKKEYNNQIVQQTGGEGKDGFVGNTGGVNRKVFKRAPTRHRFYHQNIQSQVNQANY